jgi:tetratricopeptide (TPR) repeat protein
LTETTCRRTHGWQSGVCSTGARSTPRSCTGALRLDPGNPIAENRLSEIARRRRHEKIADSLSSFEEAFRRGVEERHEGHTELALVILQRAESLAPNDACRVALAAAYRDLLKLERAEAIYRGVLRRAPNRAAQVGLAAVLRDSGRLPEAEALCRAVLARYPDDEYAQRTLRAIRADRRAM